MRALFCAAAPRRAFAREQLCRPAPCKISDQMTPLTATIRILVVRTWTELAPVRAALRELGYDVHITAVDFEPALNAALQRTSFDLVIYDPSTPSVTGDTLAARMREHGRDAPVIELTSVSALADQVIRALASLMN